RAPSCDVHRARDRAHAPGARPQLLDGLDGRTPHPWVVGQAQVVVGREADHAPVVDRGDRALGRRHHAQGPVQVALTQFRQLVVEVGEGVRACRGHGVASSVASLGTQSRMTLPEPPERAAANAALWSRKPNRSVIAGVMSSPDWSITVSLYQVSYISRP